MKTNSIIFTALLLMTLVQLGYGQKASDQNNSSMKIQTKDSHLAKAQFYRWYQLYERELNDQRIANQVDILDENIIIKSVAGETKGTEGYPERVAIYKGWKNAHHVQKVEVKQITENTFKLEADIRYQNIRPNGEKHNYAIHYNTELERSGELLPKFTTIELTPTGKTSDVFKDAYPTNRAKSLMFYWLALMEQLDGDVTPYKELLADEFELHFSTQGNISSVKDFEKWLNGAPKQLKSSRHIPENFSIRTITDNEYEMTVEFDWKGERKDGREVTARTKHIWYIVDNPNERFAKILRLDVSQLEAFKVSE